MFVVEDTNADVLRRAIEELQRGDSFVSQSQGAAEGLDEAQARNVAALVAGGVQLGVSARAQVWIVNPVVRDQRRVKFKPIFKQQNQVPGNTCGFRVKVVRRQAEAWQQLSKTLGDYRAGRNAPTFVQLQTALPKAAVLKLVPNLNDFPVIAMHADPMDSAYPSLQWQQYAAARVVFRYLQSHSWWQSRVLWAR